MSKITRVGVDLAKQVIQVHAVDAAGHRVTGRALARDRFTAWCAQLPPGCLVAMEASASALDAQGRSVSLRWAFSPGRDRTFGPIVVMCMCSSGPGGDAKPQRAAAEMWLRTARSPAARSAADSRACSARASCPRRYTPRCTR